MGWEMRWCFAKEGGSTVVPFSGRGREEDEGMKSLAVQMANMNLFRVE